MGEHDALFKRAFRLPENAAGELSAVLPKALLEAIDPGSLALVQSDELVDRWLATRIRWSSGRSGMRG
jgi:hypothetical protein